MQELLERLKKDYPELRLKAGKRFSFRPERTIILAAWPENSEAELQGGGGDFEYNFWQLQLLHEVGHALLEHKNFATDAERLQMERAAWEKAQELCDEYGVEYDEVFVEAALDSYRDWLHQRSKCSRCGLTRYQTRDGKYYCPACD